MTFDAARDEPRHSETTHFPTDPDAPDLDCETAALMRSWLRPLIDQAAGWPGLIDALSARGYQLAFRRGRLWLIQRDSGRHVCTMRHLGASMGDLARRLGRPAVRPIPGHPSRGEFDLSRQR